MKVKLDRKACIGCGACAAVCEEIFEMDDDSKAVIKGLAKKEMQEKKTDKDCVKEAEETCPVDAIKVEN